MDDLANRIAVLLEIVRAKKPLVHNITNIVSANICANVLLSMGALPIMSYDPGEVEDVVRSSQAVVLNAGTMTPIRFEAMLAAGRCANRNNIPIVLDPVGAGSSRQRGDSVNKLLKHVNINVIRGNISEIVFINDNRKKHIKGVEASEERLESLEVIQSTAKKYKGVICTTGLKDYITDGEKTIVGENGHSLMARVTGTGCMLSSLIGAFLGVCNNHLLAATAAVVSFGVAGEIAAEKSKGPGSFYVNLLDALYLLEPEEVIERGKVTVVG